MVAFFAGGDVIVGDAIAGGLAGGRDFVEDVGVDVEVEVGRAVFVAVAVGNGVTVDVAPGVIVDVGVAVGVSLAAGVSLDATGKSAKLSNTALVNISSLVTCSGATLAPRIKLRSPLATAIT